MKLLGHDKIGNWVDSVARRCEEFIIVSPFFSIDSRLKSLLTSISRLQILVGDEFSSNNPEPLKELAGIASNDVRCLYKEHLQRRLHAKVFVAIERSGRSQALVGSANFTVSGITRNEEQAVSLDSNVDTDRPMLDQIKHWIDELQDTAASIDWELARRQFESSANSRLPNFDFDSYRRNETQNYWVLKTTEGSTGRSRWREFVRERVVSIGWTDLVRIIENEHNLQPFEYTYPFLRAAAEQWDRARASKVRQAHSAKTLYWFCREFSRGDRLIVCRGFAANQTSDIHLYGLAIVDGDVYGDFASDWWLLKRPAVFMRMEVDIPKSTFEYTLNKRSLLQTIHRISQEEYEAFRRRI